MPTDHHARLAALRAQLARDGLRGFVVPLTDEHFSEYVGAYARRLTWLTGFEGSAGTAVVLADRAAIFTDGRYTIQVRDQVDGADWEYRPVPEDSPAAWLGEHAREGDRIGYDPWVHGVHFVERARPLLEAKGATLVAVERNPVDAVWEDQPARSAAPLEVYPERFAGRSAAAKRAAIADKLKADGLDAAVLSALDSVAWAFNLRGRDVSHTPVGLAYALVHDDATADLFVSPEKVTEEVRASLGNGVRLHPYDAFATHLDTLSGKKIAVDPERSVAAIFDALGHAGADLVRRRDPAVLPKAIKNGAEQAGARAAHARDGAAVARFLRWVEEAPLAPGGVDELSASDKLEALRRETGELRDLSFDTISGAGPNGAIVHYRSSDRTNRPLEPGSLYLVDSGAQYLDGTTDITRTVAVGEPSAEHRDRFTRVLRGHIALSNARFPAGTRGSQLDTLARQYLWAAGLDYAHGTGHGVGSFLSVHEGPQRIASSASGFAGGDEPLRPGMILSNEPGYYKAGEYGIRFENLVLVVPVEVAGAEAELLGFEVLTLAPIDRRLIEVGMLNPDERAWIDDYHARVAREIGPRLEGDDRRWLEEKCQPLQG